MPGSVGLESLMMLDKLYVCNENKKSEWFSFSIRTLINK